MKIQLSSTDNVVKFNEDTWQRGTIRYLPSGDDFTFFNSNNAPIIGPLKYDMFIDPNTGQPFERAALISYLDSNFFNDASTFGGGINIPTITDQDTGSSPYFEVAYVKQVTAAGNVLLFDYALEAGKSVVIQYNVIVRMISGSNAGASMNLFYQVLYKNVGGVVTAVLPGAKEIVYIFDSVMEDAFVTPSVVGGTNITLTLINDVAGTADIYSKVTIMLSS